MWVKGLKKGYITIITGYKGTLAPVNRRGTPPFRGEPALNSSAIEETGGKNRAKTAKNLKAKSSCNFPKHQLVSELLSSCEIENETVFPFS
jgi:hypothetical protein